MRVRSITTCALGLAAALSFATTLAAQQDTTRLRRTTSEQRINVSKGEVVPARVDTVFITRIDTVRVSETVTRVDTVTVVPPAPIVTPKIVGPLYWGVFGGYSAPWGNIDRVYTNGFHAGGLVGWEPRESFFGVRLDGAMHQLGREQGFNPINSGSGTALNLTLAGDVKLRAPTYGGWSLYGVAGGNYDRYKRIALAAEGTTLGQNNCDFMVRGACYENADSESWSDKFGFNFGGGLDFHIGSQDMFIEGRWMAIQANGARSWKLPISIGVRYF